MAKKKAKGKAQGKQKGAGKKKPTEKQLLMGKIEELEQELQAGTEKVGLKRVELEDWKKRWKDEVDQKEACVAYLKRVLQDKAEECHQVQNQLEMKKDLRELTESRISGQFADAERRQEVLRGLFLQQKAELEGKLLLLEELRVAKDNQTVNLQKVEEALKVKNAAKTETTRENEIAQVSRLLENRETFRELLGDLREQWRQAFLLRLPVCTKGRLDDNVGLRSLCDETTQALLAAQDEGRSIRRREKTLDVEREMQDRSEKRDEVMSARFEKKFLGLQSRLEELEDKQSVAIDAKDFEKLSSEIQQSESALSSAQDELREMNLVLKDQEEYRKTLKHGLDKVKDQNGILVSNILRAQQVLKARKSLVKGSDLESVGDEVLYQIKMLFDSAEQSSAIMLEL